ncbi:POTRA domain-containing protein [Aequorivita xiaoshiensis]|uniref:POTRA domain-containing protein n=1 Tax=Aequorivita xiaoshiensis TaxID=2874476 RepID=A0A9X1R136_9FLAO|nr:POTRA domain-containing protein [Aequorivita xiaoshiensis]MCG2431240.1 hypothetical protein [Aequorivita xiaoshiensis]
MKQATTLFLLLNIYTCWFLGINAQELTLSVKTEKPISQNLIDSLQIPKTFQNFSEIERETDTISLKLQRMGFIESEFLQINKKNDSSYVAAFYLGRKYNEIKIYYSKKNFTRTELQRISNNITNSYFTVNFEAITSSLNKLTAIRNQKGNAFARLRLTGFQIEDNNLLSASLFVDNKEIRTVDSIIVKGYEQFPVSYLKHYAGIKKGKVFDKAKLLKQNDNLNNLGFVSSTKSPEALFRKDSTTVYFYLEKQNNNLFDGILGFATDEKTQKLNFNGFLNLELNNNLNYGEQILINYKADGEEQVSFRTKLTLPYLFQSPFGLSGELKIFKRDSTFITSEQQVRTTYQINPKSATYIGYKSYDSSNLLDEAIAGNPVEDFKSKFFTAGASYITTQNKKLFPIKSRFSFEGGIGNRKKNNINEDQIGIEAIISNIFNLNFKNSIFIQNATNILISDSYLTNELFRFGGINSIRGFNENSIDASFFSIINTEYRYQFNEEVFVHSIIDLGYFENQTLTLKQNLYSFGFGLGINTNTGLFKLNIANGNTENQEFNFSNTKIHISVSSKF